MARQPEKAGDASSELVKVTLNMRPDSVAKVKQLQKQLNRSTKTDATLAAIDLAEFFVNQLTGSNPSKLMLQDSKGNLQRIVIPGLNND